VRILYSFPDGIGRSGIGTTAFQQVREVARRGVDVTLYCTSLHGRLPANVRVVETLSVLGRRIPHRVLGVGRSHRYHDRRVASALRKLAADIDVVHCWPRATLDTSGVARELGIPCFREVPNTHTAHAYEVVARERESLGLAPIPGHSHTFDARLLELEQREYAIADALLVPSEYSLQTFVDRGVPRDKLVLHRYGFDAEQFFAASNCSDRRVDRPFTAIFVGRCEPRKGLHYALRAWLDSGAADTGRLVICGAFEPEYRALLEQLLGHPSIEVRGFVAEPSALMRESDVFVFPSIEEGSALVTYEAQACGCVPVVSEATGARCKDGLDGFVHAPRDVATLTEHLRRLHTDRALLGRMRKAGLDRSRDLSWAAAGEELVQIYASRA
jgi:glycosyltransferase involved in cell wall biosynthesis